MNSTNCIFACMYLCFVLLFCTTKIQHGLSEGLGQRCNLGVCTVISLSSHAFPLIRPPTSAIRVTSVSLPPTSYHAAIFTSSNRGKRSHQHPVFHTSRSSRETQTGGNVHGSGRQGRPARILRGVNDDQYLFRKIFVRAKQCIIIGYPGSKVSERRSRRSQGQSVQGRTSRLRRSEPHLLKRPTLQQGRQSNSKRRKHAQSTFRTAGNAVNRDGMYNTFRYRESSRPSGPSDPHCLLLVVRCLRTNEERLPKSILMVECPSPSQRTKLRGWLKAMRL